MKHGTNGLKAATDAPITPLIRPFQEFAARETSGGILLLQTGRVFATLFVLAMTIPSRTELNAPEFLKRSRGIVEHFERCFDNEKGVMTPLYRLEEALHPWVTFLIMPLLALANAGVTWNHIYGAAWLGGIGFTMSLLIAALAFPNQELLAAAKMGILAGSLFAGIISFMILFLRGHHEVSARAVEAWSKICVWRLQEDRKILGFSGHIRVIVRARSS